MESPIALKEVVGVFLYKNKYFFKKVLQKVRL